MKSVVGLFQRNIFSVFKNSHGKFWLVFSISPTALGKEVDVGSVVLTDNSKKKHFSMRNDILTAEARLRYRRYSRQIAQQVEQEVQSNLCQKLGDIFIILWK